MAKEWLELTRMTQGKPITIERVRLVDSDIAIEGSFTLPPLASLSTEDKGHHKDLVLGGETG